MLSKTKSAITDDFLKKSKKVQTLGSGTFGSVGLYNTPLGQRVIKKTLITDRYLGYPSYFLAEIDILLKLRTVAGVIRLDTVCFSNEDKNGYTILEPMDCNLSQWSRQTNFETRISQLPNIIQTIGSTLAIMHNFSLIHNDLKTNNILVKSTGDAYIFKLADFGHSSVVRNVLTQYLAPSIYQPPYFINIYHSECWAFLITLIEVILGGSHLVTDHTNNVTFYGPYITRGRRVNIRHLLQMKLSDEQFKLIPESFWDLAKGIINGEYTPMKLCVAEAGFELNTETLDSVGQNIPRIVEIDERVNLVRQDILTRLTSAGLARYLNRFDKLFTKFLTNYTGSLTQTELFKYAEVAYVITSRSKAGRLLYFDSQSNFLEFQRIFLITVEYQIFIS